MRWLTRSIAVCAVAAFAVGCGAEGPQGPAGQSPEVDVEPFDDHEDCPAGGYEVIVDGETEATICDGQDGQTGEDGETPEISTERFDDHEDCPAGGVLVEIGDDETVVCDGEDGTTPIVDVQEVAPGTGPGDCPNGGVELTITSVDEDGETSTETKLICGGGEPLPEVELDSCLIDEPSDSFEIFEDETFWTYGHFDAGPYTGADAPGEIPEGDLVGEFGYGDVDTDPDNGDWTWEEADIDEDWYDEETDSFEYLVEDFEVGTYHYLYRVSIDGGDNWTYCGVDGDFELTDYDSETDPGIGEVLVAPETIAAWIFGDDDDSLDPTEGDGTAELVNGSGTFSSGGGWYAGSWITDDELPEDLDDQQYFRFASDDFSDSDEFNLAGTFRRTGTGPQQLAVVAEYDDDSLALHDEGIELASDDEESHELVISSDQLDDEDVGETADLEAIRIYGYDADGSGNLWLYNLAFFYFPE